MQTISLIAAVDQKNGIGSRGKMPWHLPADLKRFKELTTGHTVVMGRKTYESIGKPLPNRKNIILTRNKDFKADGCEVRENMGEALEDAGDGEIFVIGGGEIYNIALPLANRIYLTRIEADMKCDTFFPEIDPEIWKEVSREEGIVDEKNPQKHAFLVLEKR